MPSAMALAALVGAAVERAKPMTTGEDRPEVCVRVCVTALIFLGVLVSLW